MSKKGIGSAYFIEESKEELVRHTLSILVDNEPGVLSRIAGLFSGRGYNIESLTVSETEHETQLDRMVPVHKVVDLTVETDPLERELALIKVSGRGEKRIEALRLAEIFKARVIDASIDHFVFEITGPPSGIDQFVSIMKDLGLVEISRTGVTAIGRGPNGIGNRP
jgi:acetolactate synthase-1/3 small subunit